MTPRKPVPQQLLLGLAGLAYVLLGGSPLVLAPRMPEAGASPVAIVAFVEANQRALEWSWFLGGEIVWLPGLMFCALLTGLFWHEPATRWAALVGFVGAAVSASMTLAMSVPWGLLVYLAPQLAPSSLVLLLAETRHFGDAAVSIPLAAMLLGYGFATLRVGEARWVAAAAAGLVGALIECLHAGIDFALYGQTGMLVQLSLGAVFVWALIVSVAALMPSREFSFRRLGPSPLTR